MLHRSKDAHFVELSPPCQHITQETAVTALRNSRTLEIVLLSVEVDLAYASEAILSSYCTRRLYDSVELILASSLPSDPLPTLHLLPLIGLALHC